MATTLTTPATIFADSGITEANPPGEPSAVVKFKCAVDDRYALIKELLGSSSASGKTIVRTYPFQYPPSPNLICQSIESITAIGPPVILRGLTLPWLWKKEAIVTARFGAPAWFGDTSDPSGQPYTTTTFQISGEKVTAPQSTYKFSGGIPTNAPIGITIPIMQISMKRYMLPYAPIAEIASVAGYVNDAPLSFGDEVFAEGTVLFLGGDVEITHDTLGNVMYSCGYSMSWRYIPWNNFLHPDGTSGWQPVADGNGDPPYPPGDLSSLP
jgi:hypothetical protein